MPLVVNGTTIPTNVANALMVNGVNITQVIANGVNVWTQQLSLSVGWSGSSIVIDSSNVRHIGLQTSGFSYRVAWYADDWFDMSGAWQSVSPAGIFSGNSTSGNPNYVIQVSGNNIRVNVGNAVSSTWVTLATNGTFSGYSTSGYFCYCGTYCTPTLETSGGYVRFKENSSPGAWVRMS
jgi:hypothetical protein